MTDTRPVGRITVYCQPGARQTQWVGVHGEHPKIQLKAPPVDGAANAALVDFLAERLQVPRRAVQIVAGHSSRLKRVQVQGLDDAHLRAVLGLP